jgi:hypothetical protein
MSPSVSNASAASTSSFASFQLGFIHPGTGAFTALDDATTRQQVADATFSLIVDGVECVGEAWSLGPLDRLLSQLEHVQARVAEGQPALLRSGVESQLEVPYFLFSPETEGEGSAMRISSFLIGDRNIGWLYPDEDPHNAARLFAHVAAHREELLGGGAPDTFCEVRYPRAELLAALAAQLEAAKSAPAAEPVL